MPPSLPMIDEVERPLDVTRLKRGRLFYPTRSLCPTCNELVPGRIEEQEGKVVVTRSCPEHGSFTGLVCSDLEWYRSLPKFDVEPIKPRAPRRGVEKGCPEDCGLCARHKQIAGTAAIEISNSCNAACPTCIADNAATFDLSPEDVEASLHGLLKQQDFVDSFTLSGGEPTTHPQIFEILDRIHGREEIGRVVINTNGLRIAKDDAFLDRLAEYEEVFVSLHYDGPASKALRGIGHNIQKAALRRLNERGIKSVPVVLAAEGVNDRHLGPVVEELLLSSPHVRSTILSMMTYAGAGGSTTEGDPMKRLTIPGALDAIEESSEGRLKKADFMPLPMPNPMCAAIGYYLTMDGELTPLIPLMDLDGVIDATKNANFGKADEKMEALLLDAMERLYADPDSHPESEKVLRKLKRLLLILFPEGEAISAEERTKRAEQSIKTVYLMQFMDAWSFDASRLCKCSCQHVLPNGEVIPSCGYYAYHRQFDERFNPPKKEQLIQLSGV